MKTRPIARIIVSMAAFAASAFFSSGCVYTAYQDKDGRKLTRISVFGNQTIGKVDLKNGTMEGYQSEQAEVAGAIAGQVAAGVAKALTKP